MSEIFIPPNGNPEECDNFSEHLGAFELCIKGFAGVAEGMTPSQAATEAISHTCKRVCAAREKCDSIIDSKAEKLRAKLFPDEQR